MSIQSAEFIGSYPSFRKCPEHQLAEYAFIGRSNVGKSSLINLLTNRKNLAKTSSTPGKTQMINFFLINEQWHLVDLPGYGYAKLSKKHRASLFTMIKEYVLNREQLVNTFVLVDSRIPPQSIDLEFIDFLGQHQIPFSIVFTKVDKNKSDKTTIANIDVFKEELRKSWEHLPPIFPTSAEKKIGQEALLEYIEGINHNLKIDLPK